MSGYLQRIARAPTAASIAAKPAAAPQPAAAAAPPLDALLHEVVRWVSAPASAHAGEARPQRAAQASPSPTDAPAAWDAAPPAQSKQAHAASPGLADASHSEHRALPSPDTLSPATRTAARPSAPAWRIEDEPDALPSRPARVGEAEPGSAPDAMPASHGLPSLGTVLPARDASPSDGAAAQLPPALSFVDRPRVIQDEVAHPQRWQPTFAAPQANADGTVEVHVGSITLTVTAPPTPAATAPAPAPHPSPATPVARAPAPAPAGLRFSASRHHLRWS